MNALPAALVVAVFALPFVVIVRASLRRPLAGALVLIAAACAFVAVRDAGEPRQLVVTHSFPAYAGQEIRSKAFVIEAIEAPGWSWAALTAAWALAWAAWGLVAGRRRPPGATPRRPAAFVHALALAWGGTALVLLWQKTAAPLECANGFVPGLPPIEPAVFAGTCAAGVLLAQRNDKLLPALLYLSVFVAVVRLPIAMFGTLATQRGWGTYLDVRNIDFIANIANQQPTELAPASTEQLAWTIWFPQLLMWPALSMMSAGGLAFAVWLYGRRPQ